MSNGILLLLVALVAQVGVSRVGLAIGAVVPIALLTVVVVAIGLFDFLGALEVGVSSLDLDADVQLLARVKNDTELGVRTLALEVKRCRADGCVADGSHSLGTGPDNSLLLSHLSQHHQSCEIR